MRAGRLLVAAATLLSLIPLTHGAATIRRGGSTLPDSASTYLTLLRRGHPLERVHAARMLRAFRFPAVDRGLMRALDDPVEDVVRQALLGIGSHRYAVAVPALRRTAFAYDSQSHSYPYYRDPSTLTLIIRTLGEIGTPEAERAVVDIVWRGTASFDQSAFEAAFDIIRTPTRRAFILCWELRRDPALPCLARMGDPALDFVEEKLVDGDWHAWVAAMEVCGDMSGDRSRRILERGLSHADAHVRGTAFYGLRRRGDLTNAQIRHAFGDSAATVRAGAMDAIVKGDITGMEDLIRAGLADTSSGVRWEAMRGVREFPDRVALLTPLLHDAESGRWAVSELADRPGPEALAALIGCAAGDHPPSVHEAVALCLANMEDASSLAALKRMLPTENATVEGAVLYALASRGDPGEFGRMIRYDGPRGSCAPRTWRDPIGLLREAVRDSLVGALSHPDSLVRDRACSALLQMHAPEAVAPALEWLTEPEGWHSRAVWWRYQDRYDWLRNIIRWIGWPAFGPLGAATADPRPEVRAGAAHGLGAMGAPAADPLRRLVVDPSPQVRAAAYAAMGVLNDSSLEPFLVEGVADTDVDVSAAALRSLTEIGNNNTALALRYLERAGRVRAAETLDLTLRALDEPPKPTTAGLCWRHVWSYTTPIGITALWQDSLHGAVAVGMGGALYHLSRNTWVPLPSPVDTDLHDIWGSASGGIYAVGDHGTLLRISDDAVEIADSGCRDHLYGVWGGGDALWVVGWGGTIRRLENGTWTTERHDDGLSLRAIAGNGPDDAIAVGDAGLVLRRHGGRWDRLKVEGASDLTDVAPVGDGRSVAVGKRSEVVWIDGDEVRVETIPEWFSSSQLLHVRGPTDVLVGDRYRGDWIKYDGRRWTKLDYPIMGTAPSGPVDRLPICREGYPDLGYDGHKLVPLPTGYRRPREWADPRGKQELSGTWLDPESNVLFIAATRELWMLNGERPDIVRLPGDDRGADPYDLRGNDVGNLWVTAREGAAWRYGHRKIETLRLPQPIVAWSWPVGRHGAYLAGYLWNGTDPGGRGRMYRVDGRKCVAETLPVRPDFTGIWADAYGRPIAVGRGGAILERHDGEWKIVESGTGSDLFDIWGTAFDDVYAVGDNGTVLHRDDTGWHAVRLPCVEQLRCVWGTSPDDVFVAGDRGRVYQFDGSSWRRMNALTAGSVHDLTGARNGPVYAIGGSDMILRYDRPGE